MTPIPRHPPSLAQKSQLSRARTKGFMEICRRTTPTLTGAVQAATIRCATCGKTLLAGTVDGPMLNTLCRACKSPCASTSNLKS